MYVIRPTWPSSVSMPSYRRWAALMVRFGEKPSLRLASCCRLDVVNGGAGNLLVFLSETSTTTGRLARIAAACFSAVSPSPISGFLPVDADQVRLEGIAVGGNEDGLERPVLAGGEGADLALAVDDQPDRHRLDAPGREPGPDLAPEQRAQRVAHQPVHDSTGLLRVDQILIDDARLGEGALDGRLGDLGEGHAASALRSEMDRLRHMPGDRLSLTVKVCREVDDRCLGGGLLDCAELPLSIRHDLVDGREIVIDVHAELVLARVLGQVADVTVRRQNGVARAKISLDRFRLRRRLDDHKVVTHRRESSIRHSSGRYLPVRWLSGIGRRRAARGHSEPSGTPSGLANPPHQVRIEVVGIHRRRSGTGGCGAAGAAAGSLPGADSAPSGAGRASRAWRSAAAEEASAACDSIDVLGTSTNRMCTIGNTNVESPLSMKTGFLPFIVRTLVQIRATSDGAGSLMRSARSGCSFAIWTMTSRSIVRPGYTPEWTASMDVSAAVSRGSSPARDLDLRLS